MKQVMAALLAVSLAAGVATVNAQPGGPSPGHAQKEERDRDQDRDRDRDNDRERDEKWRSNPNVRTTTPRWSPGERLPQSYRQPSNVVQNWQRGNLPPPPRGYHWVCDQRRNCFLVANTSGVIRRSMWNDERDYRWRQRYRQTYTYSDDLYYRECRSRPDPAGILIGGLIGGLLGRAAGDDGAGATFAGIIIGGAIGAALTRDLDCDDRSYAYYSYYHAFNGGRPGAIHRWRNPRNDHRGEFRVRSYYYDDYGFRCANYSHVAFLPGRRVASGRACRQPDGAWVFLN